MTYENELFRPNSFKFGLFIFVPPSIDKKQNQYDYTPP